MMTLFLILAPVQMMNITSGLKIFWRWRFFETVLTINEQTFFLSDFAERFEILYKEADRSMKLYSRGRALCISTIPTWFPLYDIVDPFSHFEDFCPLGNLAPFEFSLLVDYSFTSCLTYRYARSHFELYRYRPTVIVELEN